MRTTVTVQLGGVVGAIQRGYTQQGKADETRQVEGGEMSW